MTTVELRALLDRSIKQDGPLPVIIWHTDIRRYRVDTASPCGAHDHFLISAGDRDQPR